jgi:hypothetical protein
MAATVAPSLCHVMLKGGVLPRAPLPAAAAARQYFKLPGEFVSLIQCDVAERISSAIGQWLETVKVGLGAGRWSWAAMSLWRCHRYLG